MLMKIGGGGGNRTPVRKLFPLRQLHACPVVYRHPAGRTRALFPPDHPRKNLVLRRRGSTQDQPTFLTELTGAMGWAPGSRALGRFRRRAQAQRCRWRLCLCPVF